MIAASNRDDQSLGFREQTLISVKGEKLRDAEMDCGGDVKKVSQPMSVCFGVTRAQILGDLMHIRPIHRYNLKYPGFQVRLQVPQHLVGLGLWETFGLVFGIKPNMEPQRLPELQQQKAGHRERKTATRHRPNVASPRRAGGVSPRFTPQSSTSTLWKSITAETD